MKRIVLSSFVMLVVVVFAATATLAADPVASCQARKLKAWAKLRSCEHKASAKVVAGGTVDPTACKTKFDAALAKAGAGCRYLDNDDGTVTDLDTGLMWQKTDDKGGLTDKDNTYTWTDESDADYTDPNGTAFTVFLAGLNNCTSADGTAMSGGFAGYCDWRLPQIDEWKTIVLKPYPCNTSPCIDQSAFGPTNAWSYCWSATSHSDLPVVAWVFVFNGGEGNPIDYGKPSLDFAQARAVRSGL